MGVVRACVEQKVEEDNRKCIRHDAGKGENATRKSEQDRHRQMQIYPLLQGSLLSVYAISSLLQGSHSTPGLSYVKYGLATLHFFACSWWCELWVLLTQHMLLTCCFTSGGARIGPLSSRCPDADSGRL